MSIRGTVSRLSEPPPQAHRLALVLADCRAVPPPGIDADAFAAACLADSYEVLADLEQVRAGIAFRARPDHEHDLRQGRIEELLWPGDLAVPLPTPGIRAVAEVASALRSDRATPFTELLVVPADLPDLPGLVLAKVAKALHRADVCLAPETGGPGLAAIGVRLPWPEWLDSGPELDLGHDPYDELRAVAPRPSALARGPGWHRLRQPAGTDRLDPGLEGWEQVRLLLSG